jgi:hypothetical protein
MCDGAERMSDIPDQELFAELHRRMRGGQVKLLTDHKGKRFESGRFMPVPDRQVVENVLALANMRDWADFVPIHAAVDRGVTMAYSTDAKSLASLQRTFTDPETGKRWQDLYWDVFAEYQREQKAVTGALETIVKKRLPAARRELEAFVSNGLKAVVVVTVPEFHRGHLALEPRPYLPTVRALSAYGIALLLDEDQPRGDKRSFGERLRNCTYGLEEQVEKPCGKWFLAYADEKGGPLPKYCSADCRLRAVSDTAPHRARKYRAKNRR